MREPTHCLPAAYRLFYDSLGRIEEDRGLTEMATAIAMHYQQDVRSEDVLTELDQMADAVRRRVHNDDPRALVAHLHQHMFDELGFRGNESEYYDPRNSFLPWVLRSRRGIPITLSLVYKLVAERLGLAVHGLNVPGHFLVETRAGDESMIVDPFHGGTMLTLDEAHGRVRQMTGQQAGSLATLMQPTTHRQWIARILANLLHVFSMQSHVEHIGAMSELYDLLKGVHP
tara:strand:- start:84 stop:770 length:687 start_codon:yes stop_codon:yes gene_type:complete